MTTFLSFGVLLLVVAYSDICVATYSATVNLEEGTFTCKSFGLSRKFNISKFCDEKQDCHGMHEKDRISYYKCTNDCPGEHGMGCTNGACLDHYCFYNQGYWPSVSGPSEQPPTTVVPTTPVVPYTPVVETTPAVKTTPVVPTTVDHKSTLGKVQPLTWTCTDDGLRGEVGSGKFEGYVIIKGSKHQCKKTLPAESGHPRTLNFGYDECGILDWGSIIVVLKSHPELTSFRSGNYTHECNGKSFTVFQGMENGTPAQTFPPARHSIRSEIDGSGSAGQAIVVIEPASLYGGFVRNCVGKVLFFEVSVTDEKGCPSNEPYFGKWERDLETETLKANFSIPPGFSSAGELKCDVETCLGRCGVQCPRY